MKALDIETDGEFLMEFRHTYYEQWVKFCAEKGYEPEVSIW